MRRVVLDCNVPVSAGLTDGTCRRVLVDALRRCAVIVGPAIVQEYRTVFLRSKFRQAQAHFAPILDGVLTIALVVEPEPSVWRSPDPKDQPYFDVAMAARADYLITGNKRHFPDCLGAGLKVVTPVDYLQLVVEC